MPIKWSALKVSEAADMIAESFKQAAEPLECAREAAKEAQKLDDLPDYMKGCFNRISFDVDNLIGGSYHAEGGRFAANVKSIRDNLPSGSLEAETTKLKNGVRATLM